MSMDYKADELP